jgi:hypothetical protein
VPARAARIQVAERRLPGAPFAWFTTEEIATLDCVELIGRLDELSKQVDACAIIVATRDSVEFIRQGEPDALARLRHLVAGGGKPCGFALVSQVGQRADIIVNPLPELLASVPEAEQPGIWEELTTVAQALGGQLQSITGAPVN